MIPAGPYDAILVLSFGGPEGPDDVVPFLENVTRGRRIPPERLAEVAGHYAHFGGVSPINPATRRLIAALDAELTARGPRLPIYWGNRNWRPMLADTVAQMAADGVRRAVCFVTSAYGGYSSCRQYLQDIAAARAQVGVGAPVIDKLRPFFDHPGFVHPFADATRAALASLEPGLAADAPLVFSAHSVPLAQPAVAEYAAEVGEASRLVAELVGGGHRWSVAWQSRSGPPSQPWLGPTTLDELAALAAGGARAVVVVPIGFIADHLEVVYDLDTDAAAHARRLGLAWARAATPGTAPEFVAMIGELIAERTDPAARRRGLGTLAPRPLDCPDDCCTAPPRPASAERGPRERGPREPGPTEPGPPEPGHSETGPAEPGHSETGPAETGPR